MEFYPSITEKLLRRAISFAKLHTTISPQDLEIILHSRKSLLFDNASTWIKKEGSKFDVTMGSYNGAEVCELIGLFILQQLSSVIPKDSVGLYRDDGLSALKLTGPQADKLRKDIIAIFKDCDLRVTVETRLTCTDFLDVNMDLTNGKYWPFRKQNSELLYINTKSNHPPNVIKQIPAAITHRIASLSCSNEEYVGALPAYRDALASSGHELPDQPHTPTTRNKCQRRRKIIWFNPPFNQNVTTNVASKFL